MKKRLLKTLETTKFAGAPIIPVAAKPGGPDAGACEAVGVEKLIGLLTSSSYFPHRDPSGPLVFAVDHCFSIRGQGTVMTGTILKGSVAINDTIEIPSMKVSRKVKSMQMFKQPVNKATQGDRVGICVTQFDPKLLERGLVCSPSTVPTIVAGLISVKRIPYYKGSVTSKSKFHITIGHETVMGRLQIFGLPPGQELESEKESEFHFSREYIFQDEVADCSKIAANSEEKENATASASMPLSKHQWVLVEFEKPVTCPDHSLVIGSRLDSDIHLNMCRIAFHGKLLVPITDKNHMASILPQLKVYKVKCREGIIERMADEYSVICRSLFKKETNIQTFIGMKVKLSTGEEGMIEGAFGQSGKVKIRVPTGLSKETAQRLSVGGKKKGGKGKNAPSTPTEEAAPGGEPAEAVRVILEFKRYKYDAKKKMIQT